jgi:MEMO1 family protein
MTRIRPAAVAGLFYPADPTELAHTVDALLDAVPTPPSQRRPVALIAPHAGYVYSGPIAASAYAHLPPWRGSITRVVVIGPAHRVAVRGLAVSSADGFATPLGVVKVDHAATQQLLDCNGVQVDDRAHAPEHSIEVHLPFLQRTLGDGWTLVPVLAAGVRPPEFADALEPFWGAPGTLCVVSTDLSHYHDVVTARELDRDTALKILDVAWELLDPDDACGVVPVRGALELARRHGTRVEQLDLRSSADTAGTPDRVVGYGSFLLR